MDDIAECLAYARTSRDFAPLLSEKPSPLCFFRFPPALMTVLTFFFINDAAFVRFPLKTYVWFTVNIVHFKLLKNCMSNYYQLLKARHYNSFLYSII